jgi:hypothetical protein
MKHTLTLALACLLLAACAEEVSKPSSPGGSAAPLQPAPASSASAAAAAASTSATVASVKAGSISAPVAGDTALKVPLAPVARAPAMNNSPVSPMAQSLLSR